MSKIKLITVMLLWGSIGVFTRYIEVSPILLAFLRALIAIPVLYAFHKAGKNQRKPNFKKIIPYIISGSILGLAWVCLFTAFKNTSISIAVLVYNMCPVYVLLLAPAILKERLSKVQVMSILGAFAGLFVIVSGAINAADFNVTGLILGIISGLLYACLVMVNRKVKSEFDSSTITMIQMISASVILLPFVFLDNKFMMLNQLEPMGFLFTAILGLVHTGLAYQLYFSTYQKLSAVTIVSYSYLEPVFSIFLSVVILKEQITVNQIIGGILILGSTYLGEYFKKA